ncbi:MAG: Hpt domain-containing protein [Chromatiales bacterium]|nr:Hpt domain-containing protein [Chromatiales bacterium]
MREALRKAAHGLKSSSANVGAEALAALCKELESDRPQWQPARLRRPC